jgi:hypothetical protein
MLRFSLILPHCAKVHKNGGHSLYYLPEAAFRLRVPSNTGYMILIRVIIGMKRMLRPCLFHQLAAIAQHPTGDYRKLPCHGDSGLPGSVSARAKLVDES